MNLKPSRSISPPGTYFVTFSSFQRRRLFVVENYARLFLKTLYSYNRDRAFLLHAFVVMPEHVHLLITPSRDKTLERVMQLIKEDIHESSDVALCGTKKFGSVDSQITGSEMRRTLRCIGNTSTGTR